MLCPLTKCEKKCTCLQDSWLFIVFLGLALLIWFSGQNHNLFLAINHHHDLLPTGVWVFFNFISYSRFFILPLLLLIITLTKRRDKLANVIILIFAYYIVFALLKSAVGETRPYLVLPADSFYWVNHFEDAIKSAHKSFPSGHTGNMAVFAFSISTMFFANKNGLKFLMLLLVLFTGFARICTGWHWPLDVISSGLVGYLLVKICFLFDLRKFSAKKN